VAQAVEIVWSFDDAHAKDFTARTRAASVDGSDWESARRRRRPSESPIDGAANRRDSFRLATRRPTRRPGTLEELSLTDWSS
jgi:hypothetical protein